MFVWVFGLGEICCTCLGGLLSSEMSWKLVREDRCEGGES